LLSYINFSADNLASAIPHDMIHARNAEVVKDIHGLRLLRNDAEVWPDTGKGGPKGD
jgi:hypothetical protein